MFLLAALFVLSVPLKGLALLHEPCLQELDSWTVVGHQDFHRILLEKLLKFANDFAPPALLKTHCSHTNRAFKSSNLLSTVDCVMRSPLPRHLLHFFCRIAIHS